MTGTGTSQVCWTGVSFHESGKTVTLKFNTSCTTFKGIMIIEASGSLICFTSPTCNL